MHGTMNIKRPQISTSDYLRLWGDGRVGRHLENIMASMSSGGSSMRGLPHRFVSILAPLARCQAWPRCSNPTVNSSGPRAHVLGSPPSLLVPFLHRCPFHCHSSAARSRSNGSRSGQPGQLGQTAASPGNFAEKPLDFLYLQKYPSTV
jgi:hypothetical protein